MAKTYLDIVKYMIEAKLNVDGLVDKPDIIGAVFGQTEGLLGDDLDLRELQKNGKIGRIEIDVSQSGSKTYGRLLLPASLDRIETCILAAAIEAVDRVGPYEAQLHVEKIEDTRAEKRRKILERAKGLVKQLLSTEIPDSKELSEMVQSDVKASEITSYGPDNLPAGPDVAKSSEVIIVEGRADVLNLLRSDITNVVAIGGAITNVPKTIINLCNEKEVTVFVDGDRGGEMIVRSILNVAEIDYVARAPDGKEVEELTRKEIIKGLRSRIPIDQYLGVSKHNDSNNNRQPQQQQKQQQQQQQQKQQQQQQPQAQKREAPESPPAREAYDSSEEASEEEYEDSRGLGIKDLREDHDEDKFEQIESVAKPIPVQQQPQRENELTANAPKTNGKPALESIVLAELSKGLNELSNTLRARLYDASGAVIKEVPIRELIMTMQDTDNVYGVVLDGIVTKRLVELALQKKIRAIYGIGANPMPRKYPEIIIYTKE